MNAPARAAQAIVALAGLVNTMSGAALLFAPRWFYEEIGDFPPFNRHYAGDAGTFILPVGVALLVAAARPLPYRSVIVLAAAIAVLHAGNHAYDAALGRESAGDLAPIVALAVLLAAAAIVVALERDDDAGERTRTSKGLSPNGT